MTDEREVRSPIDRVDEQYLVEEGDVIEYDSEGSEAVELAYKMSVLSMQDDEELSENHQEIVDESWGIEMMTLGRCIMISWMNYRR